MIGVILIIWSFLTLSNGIFIDRGLLLADLLLPAESDDETAGSKGLEFCD